MKINITKRLSYEDGEKMDATIASILKLVNGRAISQTFTHRYEVRDAAHEVERTLDSFGIPKKNRRGIIAEVESGGVLSSAYKYDAVTTTITIERGSRDWFLTDVRASKTYPCKKPTRKIFVDDVLVNEVEIKRRRDHHIELAGYDQ